MIQLTPEQLTSLKDWFIPDRPGPLIGLHVLQTGNGACFADRWPNPRALLVNTAGNYSLAGDPTVLKPADIQEHIAGVVEAPENFVPLLSATFPDLVVWDRVILALTMKPTFTGAKIALIRRLEAGDSHYLWGLSPETNWIHKTWGGPGSMAASGCAWGAFIDERLVSVACTFFVGLQYEELGVVTEPAFRGLGLSVACAGQLCVDIQGRSRWPSWTTSTDNIASFRVAEKLGFTLDRHDRLYLIGIEVPPPPQKR